MPHVVVKLWPGKSEKQKIRLAEEIVKDVMTVLHYGEESVSLVYCPANNWTMNPDSPMLKGCRDRYPHWTSKKQMHGNCDSGYRPSVRRSKWR